MNVSIIYRANSDHERRVLDFEQEYNRRTGRWLQLLDINTVAGDEKAKLYEIVQYPALIATADDGHLIQMWQGENLPLMNEVMYYDQN